MKVQIINEKMLCWDDNESESEEALVLAKTTECQSVFAFKAIDSEGHVTTYKNAKPITSTKQRTIEDGLKVDDVIENDFYKRKILAICGNIIIPSVNNDFNIASDNFTLDELIYREYKLKQPQEEPVEQITELSFKDISEGKGKGIPEHLIRIKDDKSE